MRKELYAKHHIPPSYELHASDFINGRGHPSNRHWNRSSRNRRIVAEASPYRAATLTVRLILTAARAVRRKPPQPSGTGSRPATH